MGLSPVVANPFTQIRNPTTAPHLGATAYRLVAAPQAGVRAGLTDFFNASVAGAASTITTNEAQRAMS